MWKEGAVADLFIKASRDATVGAVASLKMALLSAMDKASPEDSIVFDISGVEQADSALAQLIISFRLEAKQRKLNALIEGEHARLSVSVLLGCDVVCEACTFNDFRTKYEAGSKSDAPKDPGRVKSASGSKGARA